MLGLRAIDFFSAACAEAASLPRDALPSSQLPHATGEDSSGFDSTPGGSMARSPTDSLNDSPAASGGDAAAETVAIVGDVSTVPVETVQATDQTSSTDTASVISDSAVVCTGGGDASTMASGQAALEGGGAGGRAAVFAALLNFLRVWDPACLARDPRSGKSALATLIPTAFLSDDNDKKRSAATASTLSKVGATKCGEDSGRSPGPCASGLLPLATERALRHMLGFDALVVTR